MSRIIKAPKISERDYILPAQNLCGRGSDGPENNPAAEGRPEAEREVFRREIEAEAMNRGRVQGRAEAEREFAEERAENKAFLRRLDGEVHAAFIAMEQRLAEAVVAMTEKIVGTVADLDLQLVRQSVRKVLARQHMPGEVLTLHLHPEDHDRLAPDASVTPTNLKLTPDTMIKRGGCLLETRYGHIDARLETQVQELGRVLKEQLLCGQNLAQASKAFEHASEIRAEGQILNVVGTVLESRGPHVTVGEQCEIENSGSQRRIRAEVIGFKENRVLFMPLEDARGIGPGSRVLATDQMATVRAGEHLLGRVLNGLGAPIDGLGPLADGESIGIHARPNNPMQRRAINSALYTGIRAIDGLLTCAKGGRMGIFSGSGVGKSVLLGMMARNTQADINVIALIGERGREVREFVERDLGEAGRKRSIVVAVTSDESPVLRIHGANLAASVAEYFARQGKDVLFMMDSVTRFAMAQREIGLAAGEPPATKGYTPSTFALLPKLLERSGTCGEHGSITGFYTVLVEGDDMDEPVADHVRSILDGHIVLSRALFAQNQFPAIDVLRSISRLAKQVIDAEYLQLAGMLRNLLATYEEAQDLVNIGAYAKGSNGKIDTALKVIEDIRVFLKQGLEESSEPAAVWEALRAIAAKASA